MRRPTMKQLAFANALIEKMQMQAACPLRGKPNRYVVNFWKLARISPDAEAKEVGELINYLQRTTAYGAVANTDQLIYEWDNFTNSALPERALMILTDSIQWAREMQ